MKDLRTDLALEARELWQEDAEDTTKLCGVAANQVKKHGMTVTRVQILDENGVSALGKPMGNYTTVELDGIPRHDPQIFSHAIAAVAEEIKALMPDGDGCVLVAGLGNPDITPDAVGTQSARHIMVTRHLVEKLPEYFGSLRPVSAVTPGVLGITGVESREMLEGVAEHVKPAFIIVIDALASRKLSRLCSTVQITDTGIIPGSGVGNSRLAINRDTMGVPVLAVGVPTVVDIRTILCDTAAQAGMELPIPDSVNSELLVTPKEIDTHIRDVGRIIGYGINSALQPGVTLADMDSFLA